MTSGLPVTSIVTAPQKHFPTWVTMASSLSRFLDRPSLRPRSALVHQRGQRLVEIRRQARLLAGLGIERPLQGAFEIAAHQILPGRFRFQPAGGTDRVEPAA